MGKPGRDRALSPVNPGEPPPGRRCVLKGPPVEPGGEDITWLDQVAPRGRKASSTRKIKHQTSNILSVCGLTGTPERVSLLGLGGK